MASQFSLSGDMPQYIHNFDTSNGDVIIIKLNIHHIIKTCDITKAEWGRRGMRIDYWWESDH
jgi:hypothetical protein